MPLQHGSGAGASAVAGGSLGVGVWATSRMADEQDGVEVMEPGTAGSSERGVDWVERGVD
jgi:hypothetical protein